MSISTPALVGKQSQKCQRVENREKDFIEVIKYEAKLSLYNPNGVFIWEKALNPGINNIDISSYAKGVYLLKSDNQLKKVLVQ